jgi:hypothetical protein
MMNTSIKSSPWKTRGIVTAVSLAMIASAVTPQSASAHEWQRHQRQWQGHEQDQSGALALGVGIAALAGLMIAATAAPAYPAPQPVTMQEPPFAGYAQSAPTCTMINGYAACIGPDGTWQYVR